MPCPRLYLSILFHYSHTSSYAAVLLCVIFFGCWKVSLFLRGHIYWMNWMLLCWYVAVLLSSHIDSQQLLAVYRQSC